MGDIAQFSGAMADNHQRWRSLVASYDDFYVRNIHLILEDDHEIISKLIEMRQALELFLEGLAANSIRSPIEAAQMLEIAMSVGAFGTGTPQEALARAVAAYLRELHSN